MKKAFGLFVAIIISLLVCSQVLLAQDLKTVKIGALSPHSGPVAYFGLSVFHSVELAAENINKNGTT